MVRNGFWKLPAIVLACGLALALAGCSGSSSAEEPSAGWLGETFEVRDEIWEFVPLNKDVGELGVTNQPYGSSTYRQYRAGDAIKGITHFPNHRNLVNPNATTQVPDPRIEGHVLNNNLHFSVGSAGNSSGSSFFVNFGNALERLGYMNYQLPSDVNGNVLVIGDGNGNYVVRELISQTTNADTSSNGTDRDVIFVWVDDFCTISATGRSYNNATTAGIAATQTRTIESFDINLGKGWNAIYKEETWTSPVYPGVSNTTVKITSANPGDLHWTLSIDDNGDPNGNGGNNSNLNSWGAPFDVD